MNINFIDAEGKTPEDIKGEVQNSTNQACAIYNIGLQDVKNLANYLSEDANRIIHAQFSKIRPKPVDVFLVDKNHEVNFNGRQIAQKNTSYDIRSIVKQGHDELTEKLRLATIAAKIGVWTWNIKTDEVIWDEGMKTLYGRNNFDGTIASFEKMIHPDDVGDLFKEVHEQINNSKEFNYFFRIVKPNGQICHMKAVSSIEDVNGIELLIGVNWDITEEKVAEQNLIEVANKLRDSEEKFALAIKGSNDGYFDSDLESGLTYFSDRYYEILGITGLNNTQDEHFWSSFLHEDDKERVFRVISEAESKDVNAYEVESRRLHKAGHYVSVLTKVHISRNSKGKPIRATGVLSDLTKMKKAFEAIEENEAKHKFIVNASQELVCIHEIDGIYKFVSPSALNLIGYTPEELIGTDPYSYFHPEDVDRIRKESHEPILDGVEVGSIQYRFRKKNGEYIWFETYKKLITDENGNLISILTRARDITALKKTETELAGSKAFLENIANHIPGIMLQYKQYKDGKDEFSYFNKEAENIWELSAEVIRNDISKAWDRVHPDDLQGLIQSLELSKQNLSLWENDHRFIMADGRVKWLSARGVPIRDDEGSTIWHNLIFDITERKNTQIKLAKSEKLLAQIADNIPGVIWRYIRNPEGYDTLDYISKGVEPIWETSREEILNNVNLIWESIHPEDIWAVINSIEESRENLTPWECEYRIIMPDGRIKWLSAAGQPSLLDNGNIMWQSLALDVTDKRETEIQLIESEEMLSDITNNLPGLILRYILYPDGSNQIQFVSDNCDDLWEVSKEDALADVSKVWAKIHPDDLQQFSETVDKSAAEISLWKAEWRLVMDDGRVKWISGIGQPKKLEDGSVLWHILQLDITNRKNAEIELEKTLNQLNLSIDTSKMGIWELNVKDGSLDWNHQMFEIFGVEKATFNNNVDTFTKSVHPADAEYISKELAQLSNGKNIRDLQFRIIRPDGQVRHILATGNPSSYKENGEIEKFMGANIDVTYIAENQERLEVAIHEKDTLFKELHHRIKNNLQMVSSLLYIKSSMTEDLGLKSFINETSTKIHSISSIHEQLLQLQGVNQLDIKDYLESLCHNLIHTYSYGDSQFELNVKLDSLLMDIDKVLNIGLIVNEIISNTMKYAYPESSGGIIHVIFKNKNNKSVLTVSDEGIGIPNEKMAVMDNSYGMQLISLFTTQIGGTIDIENSKGTKFTIKFHSNV